MANWREQARGAIFAAAHSDDPQAVPEYRIPKHKPWWVFWRPTEWETVRGISRAALERAAEAQRADVERRLALLKRRYPDASPYVNLYSPWLDA
jgi:hypothetical protein